jgi:hypothetical protein
LPLTIDTAGAMGRSSFLMVTADHLLPGLGRGMPLVQ